MVVEVIVNGVVEGVDVGVGVVVADGVVDVVGVVPSFAAKIDVYEGRCRPTNGVKRLGYRGESSCDKLSAAFFVGLGVVLVGIGWRTD